jgi:hypothetical protein
MKAQLLGLALITTLLTCSAADNFSLRLSPIRAESIKISVPESTMAMLSILVMAGFTFRRIRK